MQNKLAERSTWIESRFFQKHKDKIKNATPKVNNKAPVLNVNAFYSSTAIRNNVARLTQIDNDNYKLVKRINTIYRTQGINDCSKPTELDKNISNKLPRETINKQIYKQNIKLLTKIINTKPRIDFDKIKKDQKTYEKTLLSTSKYLEYYKKTKKLDPLFVNNKIPNNNIRIKKSNCYLDIADSTQNRQLGRLIIELYDGVVPKTVLNFLMLCHRSREHQPGYAGTEFFRINPGLFCLGGDVQYSVGLGGVTAYAQRYSDNENYALSHNAPGTLSMFSFETNYNASQFLITFKPLRTLDGKHVVFGRVIRGLNTLKLIENSGFPSGSPKHKIIISKCGKFPDCS